MKQLNVTVALFALIHLASVSTTTAADEQAALLKVTVGEPTLLSTSRRQNTQLVMASRTGVVETDAGGGLNGEPWALAQCHLLYLLTR